LKEIDLNTVNELLYYDPQSGKLFWKPREDKFFKNPSRYKDPWNARFSHTEALGYVGKHGYKVGQILGIKIRSHRVVWAINYGYWPKLFIDHVDGDKTNNRLDNLRLSNDLENQHNQKIRGGGTSKYKGVSLTLRGNYKAAICKNNKSLHIGCFDTEIEAAIAYDNKAKELFGEFARINGV
jgi:hypothetical protein